MNTSKVSLFYLIGWVMSHRSNLLRKDFEYYTKNGWLDNPDDPYVWMDNQGLWYKQIAGTKERIYYKPNLILESVGC